MKLYIHPLSSNSRKVTVTAALLGLTPETVIVELAKGQQYSPEHLALNPNGKVPVLVDGDFVLTESHAIMTYLAEQTPGQTLYPTEIHARADVSKWLFWCASHWMPAIGTLNYEHMVKKFRGKGDADPAFVAHAEEAFHTFAKILDAHLARYEWLTSKRLTLADVAVATALMAQKTARLPLEPYANIARWFAAFQDLEAWKKTAL